MASLLELCAAVAVAGSLLVVLLFGAAFALSAVVTARARRRPDPVAAALDRFLVELAGGEAGNGPEGAPSPLRTDAASGRTP